MLAMHANSGITFDLPALREKSGLQAMRLTGLVGFGADAGAAASSADFTVFVDTELKFQKLKLRKDEAAVLDVEVPATAKTLTLIATDGGDGIGSDLLFIGDPKLAAEAGDKRITEADAAILKQLRAETNKLEAEIKALPEPREGLCHRLGRETVRDQSATTRQPRGRSAGSRTRRLLLGKARFLRLWRQLHA